MKLNIIFSVAFISVVAYLLVFFRFSFMFPKRYPEIWKRLGCPELFGLQGQATYLSVILGIGKTIKANDLDGARGEVIFIRVTLGVAFLAFLIAAILTG